MSASPVRGPRPNARLAFTGFNVPIMVGVALVVAVGLLFVTQPAPGPHLPPATGSVTPSASATPQPTSTSSAITQPTTSASANPSPTSSPVPTTRPAVAWTGLTWSDPVALPPGVELRDVAPWGNGYVAIGNIARTRAAFLTSDDGLHWTVQSSPKISLDRTPSRLVALGRDLFAFSDPAGTVPLIWRSSDGVRWSVVASRSWASAWVGHVFFDVVGGPGGMVAIGNASADGGNALLSDPMVLYSDDGMTWRRTALEGAGELSVVRDVIDMSDGFAVLGGEEVGFVSGVGTPQAWWSPDGLSWPRATVAGAKPEDNQFESGAAFRSRDGLVARTQLLCAGCAPTNRTWVSSDGRSWERAGGRNVEPPYGMLSGDGRRLVVLSSAEQWKPIGDHPEPYPGLTHGWVSSDGLTWDRLSLSRVILKDNPGLSGWWVVRDGVIVNSAGAIWFGTATTH